MAKNVGHSGRLSFFLKTMLLGLVALTAMGTADAKAEELKDWQYDAQTRSLTLVLPDSVTPLVSVLAPDQLLLELPDTQVGNVMGQTVQDGVVDSIVLEQATPETVWVVMEFATGTVLSASQNAIPLSATENGDQQWQIRPALAAASRRAASQSAVATPGTSANSLRPSSNEIAQVPDFSDLPMLEPAVPDEAVSVPPLAAPAVRPSVSSPITATPAVPVTVPPLAAPALETSPVVSTPPLEAAESSPVFDVEVIPAEPVVSEPAPVEPVASSEDMPVVSDSLPFEPPFLGDNDELAEDLATDDVNAAPPVPIFVDLEVVGADSEDETVAEVISETDGLAEPAVVVDAAVADRDSVADVDEFIEESPDSRIASGREVTDAEILAADQSFEASSVEPAVTEAIQSSARPATTSRWPEPIPFGQPLPR